MASNRPVGMKTPLSDGGFPLIMAAARWRSVPCTDLMLIVDQDVFRPARKLRQYSRRQEWRHGYHVRPYPRVTHNHQGAPILQGHGYYFDRSLSPTATRCWS